MRRGFDGDPEDPDPVEGLRLQAPRPIGRGDRRDRETHRREGGGTDPAAHADQQVHRASLAARRQEVARAIRDPDAQAPPGHPRAHPADAGRADEAGPERGGGRGDQELAMATLDVINLDKKKVGTIELADALVNASLENADALFYETVKAFLASRRAGTHAVKNRSLVSGGGKKPWRQKGTGRARQGSIRASQWVGGGKAMGPKPRDYAYSVPKRCRRRPSARPSPSATRTRRSTSSTSGRPKSRRPRRRSRPSPGWALRTRWSSTPRTRRSSSRSATRRSTSSSRRRGPTSTTSSATRCWS